MLENLSFVLMGMALIVAILTFMGAHSSPLSVPNISKPGCIVSVILLMVGVAIGMYPPVSDYNQCASMCADAIADLEKDHGGNEVSVAPGRVAYQACQKGALQVKEKARLAEEEAKKAGTTVIIDEVDPAVIQSRCTALAREACTITCFNPEEA